MKVALLLILIKLVGVFMLVPRFGYLGSTTLAVVPYIPGAALCVWKVGQIVGRESRRLATAG
jgi:hypothetical protein